MKRSYCIICRAIAITAEIGTSMLLELFIKVYIVLFVVLARFCVGRYFKTSYLYKETCNNVATHILN